MTVNTRPPVVYSDEGKGTTTPWGRAQTTQRYARGITQYTTAGHGGFKLSPTRNAQVHKVWRDQQGWYEEDCEWAIVALTFPEFFTEKDLDYAHDSVGRWYPEQYKVAYPHCADCGEPLRGGHVTIVEYLASKPPTHLHEACRQARCGYCSGRGWTRPTYNAESGPPCIECNGTGKAAAA